MCFYFQNLGYQASWLMYGEEFRQFLKTRWIQKVNHSTDVGLINDSDVIVYQEVSEETSTFCNRRVLQTLVKPTCRLIMMPCIYVELELNELRARELNNKVDITVSDLMETYKDRKLMLTKNHPTTFLFLLVVDRLCNRLNVTTFSNDQKSLFLQNDNYMGLPCK